MKNRVVLALSGGMDSTTLLAHLLDKGNDVVCFGFTYGSKHNKYENKAALDVAEHYHVPFQLLDLSGIMKDFKSNLMLSGGEIPEGHYAAPNMSQTVVPGRNIIFLSILAGIAWSIEAKQIAIGIHTGDHCVVEDSMVMTPLGPRPICELVEGDTIYSYNTHNEVVELDTVKKIIKKGVPSEVLRITLYGGESLDVTEEHKIYRLFMNQFDSNLGWKKLLSKERAETIKRKDNLVIFKTDQLDEDPTISTEEFLTYATSRWITKGYELDISDGKFTMRTPFNRTPLTSVALNVSVEDYFKIIAWYITEGFTNTPQPGQSQFSSVISQSASINPENVEEISDLLNRILGKVRSSEISITHALVENDNGVQHDVKEVREIAYYISGVLSSIFKLCGSRAIKKRIPNFMMRMLIKNCRLREMFLQTCVKGDGHIPSANYRGEYINYVSYSTKLIEQIAFLFRLSGYNVSFDKDTVISMSKPTIKKYARTFANLYIKRIKSILYIPNNKHVYDIEVEKNHNFFTGKHGSVLVSNSVYEDCRTEFYKAMDSAIYLGTGGRVEIIAPFDRIDKTGIVKIGLGLRVPYNLTRTCYKDQPIACSLCGSCTERREAFSLNNVVDPIPYEGE